MCNCCYLPVDTNGLDHTETLNFILARLSPVDAGENRRVYHLGNQYQKFEIKARLISDSPFKYEVDSVVTLQGYN